MGPADQAVPPEPDAPPPSWDGYGPNPGADDGASEDSSPTTIGAELNGACAAPPRGSLAWFSARLTPSEPAAPLAPARVFEEELLRAAADLDAAGADVITWQALKTLVKDAAGAATAKDWEAAVKNRRKAAAAKPARASRVQPGDEQEDLDGQGEAEPKSDTRAGGWETRLRRTLKGDLVSHVANAITILRHDINWRGVLAWDVFLQQIVCRREPAWYADDAPTKDTSILDDDGEIRLAAWLFRAYGLAVTKETAGLAAHVVAKGAAFDSLTDYLDTLAWDQTPRIDGWLTTYLGAPDTAYTRLVGAWFLISAAARAYVPGIQADHAIILEGEQSERKSSTIRKLFGGYFSESPIDLQNKDRFINIQGIWCQSFDELAGLLKSENEPAKNFITATEDRYRPPYGRHPVKVKRRCVFAGTVNPGGNGYLTDTTGNRRYWPVPCGVMHGIDIDAVERDREQLFAEAVVRWRAGSKWWPSTRAEADLCKAEQELRQQDAPLDETIAQWLNGSPIDCRACKGDGDIGPMPCTACHGLGKAKPFKPSLDAFRRRYVTQKDVLDLCLGVPARDHNRHTSGIAGSLTRLGWKRPPGEYRPKRMGAKVTAYYHPDDLANEAERAAIEKRLPFGAEAATVTPIVTAAQPPAPSSPASCAEHNASPCPGCGLCPSCLPAACGCCCAG